MADHAVCVVCCYPRSRSADDYGTDEVFICAKCQADARQLFAIQDSIYGASDRTTGPPPAATE